ncbi:MAG: efflux RND transporter permease subunit [Candidatus Scalindua sp.]|nr:efflux RND transporter permease subunit [Candidatus Scalindua sp.]MBT6561622.1 efflux RND transporter permease subunit [Candidatus Scalindua sp.]MBT7211498.1 efflux RND transporter permease subunit [Candidatus Scalindua sp.]
MRIVEFSTRRRVTVVMLMLTLVIFGLISYKRLPINLLPDISYPTLTVRTEYPGAAPSEIENLISKPIEDAVSVISDVVRVSSRSRSDVSEVVIEFAWKTNMDFSSMDVREKLDLVDLPDDAERSVLMRFDPSLDPIMRLSLYGDEDLITLRILTEEELKPVLEGLSVESGITGVETVSGVAAVRVSGGLEEEIHVDLEESRLANLGIPISLVIERLSEENINLTAGNIKEGEVEYIVRTFNEFRQVEEINDIVIDYKNSVAIKVKDIGRVSKSHKERDVITRVNGNESVEVAIFKEADANTVTVARLVKGRLGGIEKKLRKFSDTIRLDITFDQSRFIESSIKEVISTALWGGILAVIVLFLFLRSIKSTLIIGLAIPISIISTFFFMYISGVSLNIMSLGGLALGIGMLVDNAIVVLESIDRYHKSGHSAIDSARKGASEVGRAVIASTLTTICVFVPIIFVKGIAGQLFNDQALTVTYSLLISLLVAITLIPMLSSVSVMRRRTRDVQKEKQSAAGDDSLPSKILYILLFPLFFVFNTVFSTITKIYPRVLGFALSNKLLVFIVAFSILCGSWCLFISLGKELIPELSQGEFSINVRKSTGTPLSGTLETVKKIEEIVRNNPAVDTIYSIAGSTSQAGGTIAEERENIGEINISLREKSNHGLEEDVMASLRERLKPLPAVEYKFSRPAYFSYATPVEIEINGYNLNVIERLSEVVMAKMEEVDGLTDIKSTVEEGIPEAQIIFDRQKLSQLGLDLNIIANIVRDNVLGNVSTEFSKRDRKIDIRVRARKKDVGSIEDLENFIVNPGGERPIPLAAVAEINVKKSPGEIRRLNQERVAIISANLIGRDLRSSVTDIEKKISDIRMPDGYEVSVSGQSREMLVAFSSMSFAILLAVFLVYIVMASQFESLLHPLVIMFTIPFALVGVAVALFVTSKPVSVIVLIGVVMLAGIVVNNAIILVDCINSRIKEGMPRREAIIEGGKIRLRPIMMTTTTTILGLLPLALGLGEGAELRMPMGITVIGGLLFSTLLTLILVPVVYDIVEKIKESVWKREYVRPYCPPEADHKVSYGEPLG